MTKKWQVAERAPKEFFEKFVEISPISAQLLYSRGLREQTRIDEFFNPDYGDDIHNPFLFNQMGEAVERILKAREAKEKVVIFGDYDADGVTSTALLAKLFTFLDIDFTVYIPHRETEGYGINMEALQEFKKNGAGLIVTVDCGVTAVEQIKWAKEQGIDVVVTDHHQPPPELPKEAVAIINPRLPGENYPFKELAGVGVAFKLAQALLQKVKEKKLIEDNWEAIEKWLLDLVAIGTVADCVTLLGENRTLVKYGLIVLNKTKNLGLKALVGNSRAEIGLIDSEAIGFQIAPRLNAAGRMDHANTAYGLLVSENSEEVKNISDQLEGNNQNRQAVTEKIVNEVKDQIEKEIAAKKNKKMDNILFAIGDTWPVGLVGLVAGKVSDFYHRPCLVMTRSQSQREEIVGSGRSIPEFNITNALGKVEKYLEAFGGHSQACGFSLKDGKNLVEFKKAMKKIAESELAGKDLSPVLEIDAEVALEDVNWDLFEQLEKFAPYGEGNEEPVFLARGLTVVSAERVGKTGDHLRLLVKHNTATIRKTIGFCFANAEKKGNDWCAALKPGDKVDLVFEVGVNEWNGNRELQLKIEDIKMFE